MLRKDQSRFLGALTVGIVKGKDDRIENIGAIIRGRPVIWIIKDDHPVSFLTGK